MAPPSDHAAPVNVAWRLAEALRASPHPNDPAILLLENNIEDVCRELNARMSGLSRVLEVSGSPIAVLENVDGSEGITVGPGAKWELPEGARAYLLKSATDEDLIPAVKAVAAAIAPEGTANSITRRKNPGRNRSVLGISARKNPGIPIVRALIRVRWRGRKGKAKPGTETSRIRVAA